MISTGIEQMVGGDGLTERRRERKENCVCGEPLVEDGGAAKI